MRKLIIILALIVVATISYSQKVTAFTTDTITNTETVVTFETIQVSPTTDVVVVILATNLTGTTAGTAVFQGSIDGTIFQLFNSRRRHYDNYGWCNLHMEHGRTCRKRL